MRGSSLVRGMSASCSRRCGRGRAGKREEMVNGGRGMVEEEWQRTRGSSGRVLRAGC